MFGCQLCMLLRHVQDVRSSCICFVSYGVSCPDLVVLLCIAAASFWTPLPSMACVAVDSTRACSLVLYAAAAMVAVRRLGPLPM
jgi:hypothetical protein